MGEEQIQEPRAAYVATSEEAVEDITVAEMTAQQLRMLIRSALKEALQESARRPRCRAGVKARIRGKVAPGNGLCHFGWTLTFYGGIDQRTRGHRRCMNQRSTPMSLSLLFIYCKHDTLPAGPSPRFSPKQVPRRLCRAVLCYSCHSQAGA